MEFYISPDQRQNVERKIKLMLKHIPEENRPNVTFGNVEQVVKQTTYDYGMDGHETEKIKLQAVKVTIDDIVTNDWLLVATVDYKDGLMLISDAKHFKEIPEQYGLQYTKCDYCGCIHKSRKESHILYNLVTGQWMQVGSTCVNKMIAGSKYLNGFMLKLYEYIKICLGCDGDEWFGGRWRPSKKYLFAGINIDEAMAVCLAYMDENGRGWQKAEWGKWGKEVEGTNDHLIAAMGSGTKRFDEELFKKIREYYISMDYGEVDEYGDKTLTQKIIDAFNNDFITLGEMYIAWFAIDKYLKSIETADFEQLVKSKGVEKGMKIDICGKLLSQNFVSFADEDGYYFGIGQSYAYETSWEDVNTGLVFKKNVSEKEVVKPFLCEDGLYRFNADVKYIAFKGGYVGLGGRLRKQKKVKYVEPQN